MKPKTTRKFYVQHRPKVRWSQYATPFSSYAAAVKWAKETFGAGWRIVRQ